MTAKVNRFWLVYFLACVLLLIGVWNSWDTAVGVALLLSLVLLILNDVIETPRVEP